jgi:hypothetical protein
VVAVSDGVAVVAPLSGLGAAGGWAAAAAAKVRPPARAMAAIGVSRISFLFLVREPDAWVVPADCGATFDGQGGQKVALAGLPQGFAIT